LAIINYLVQQFFLIKSPSTLKFNWAKELENFLQGQIKTQDIKIIMHGKDDVDNKINIISYDLAIKLQEKIESKKFNTIIIDECHYLKNSKTKRSFF
jgi:SWI/SNF-related matrix-associated actin-dependent regulator of chromatin subfamily A-like protein 1